MVFQTDLGFVVPVFDGLTVLVESVLPGSGHQEETDHDEDVEHDEQHGWDEVN